MEHRVITLNNGKASVRRAFIFLLEMWKTWRLQIFQHILRSEEVLDKTFKIWRYIGVYNNAAIAI